MYKSAIGAITLVVLTTVTPSLVTASKAARTFDYHGATMAGNHAGTRNHPYIVINGSPELSADGALAGRDMADANDVNNTTNLDVVGGIGQPGHMFFSCHSQGCGN